MDEARKKDGIALISRSLSRQRILAKSRVISRTILGKSAPDLDVAYVDTIEAIHRFQAAGEVTVGMIAEHMCIDPSRASRAVSHLLDRKMVYRDVSQEDGRRTVICLTEKARELMQEKIRFKQDLIESLVDDWPLDEVEEFARLYSRFIDRFEEAAMNHLKDGEARAQKHRKPE